MTKKNMTLKKGFICAESRCTGCMACYNACVHEAIDIKEMNGFYYPVIDIDKCKDCGKCTFVCPIHRPANKQAPLEQKAYAIFNKNKEIRDTSSSGGVFISLANNVLSKNGVIYGAAYGEDLEVKHIRVDHASELYKLQGSKYVQSSIGYCYRNVRDDLKNGCTVLFSGVSCQIAGLKQFLNKDYPNLYTCEILCHGGASPVAFKNHLAFIGQINSSMVTSVNFRHKTTERCQNLVYGFQNGTTVTFRNPLEDLYYNGFQNGTVERKGCFKCQHIGIERCGDLVLADFWGVNKEAIRKPDEISYPSLVFINTDRGREIYTECAEDWIIAERPLSEAIQGNLALKRHLPYSKWNARFFNEMYEYGYEKAAMHCLTPHFNMNEFIKRTIGPQLTHLLMKWLKR